MLSSGANVIIWDKMLSSGSNVIMVLSGAYVIIWCYHVMLSSGMITYPFFIFPENFTHSSQLDGTALRPILSYLIVQTLFLNKEYLLNYHINQVIMVAENYKILTSKQIISEELILFTSLLKIN